jgi:hypothetical protein
MWRRVPCGEDPQGRLNIGFSVVSSKSPETMTSLVRVLSLRSALAGPAAKSARLAVPSRAKIHARPERDMMVASDVVQAASSPHL